MVYIYITEESFSALINNKVEIILISEENTIALGLLITKITTLYIYKVSGPKLRFLDIYKDTIILIK